MALRKTISVQGKAFLHHASGVAILGDKSLDVNAYIKVESINGSKDNIFAVVSFTDDVITMQTSYGFDYDLEGPNPIKQAYLHLKSLPEFADAVDC